MYKDVLIGCESYGFKQKQTVNSEKESATDQSHTIVTLPLCFIFGPSPARCYFTSGADLSLEL